MFKGQTVAGFPRIIRTKLLYMDNAVQSVPAGVTTPASTTWIYRINSVYDPFFATGGHQPRYYDQYAAAGYSSYRVLGFKIEIRAMSQSGNGTAPAMYEIGLLPVPNTWTNANPSRTIMFENSFARMRSVTDFRSSRLAMYVKPWEIQGIHKQQYKRDDNLYSAAINANPAVSPLMICSIFNWSGAVVACLFTAKCTYYVEFYRNLMPSDSVHAAGDPSNRTPHIDAASTTGNAPMTGTGDTGGGIVAS